MPTPTPNLQVTPPETLGALQSQLVNALAADEAVAVTTVAGGSQTLQGATLNTKVLATPGAPTITTSGTAGATTYTYKVVAKIGAAPLGRPTAASAAGSTTTGNATLSASNFNIVTFTCVPYATSYDIYRTAGGSAQGKIANVLQPAAVVAQFPTSLSYQTTATTAVLNDTGLAGDSSTAPTVNLTGSCQNDTHGDVNVVALSAPYNLAVANAGTAGSTAYTYVVSAVDSVGEVPCTGVATATGNATLTSGNSNLITWNDTPGAQYYNIYRSASSGTPGTTGLIGTVYPSGAATYSFSDTGIAVITTRVPTTNTTGSVKVPGSIFCSGLVLNGPTSANTTAGNAALTVANMLSSVLLRSGSTTPTDTTPTAAAIIGGLAGTAVANTGWYWLVRNAGSGTQTLGQAATGITWASTQTNTVATVSGHLFYIYLTNVTPGSEAITIYSVIGSVAY
jgi:hypothetical protein